MYGAAPDSLQKLPSNVPPVTSFQQKPRLDQNMVCRDVIWLDFQDRLCLIVIAIALNRRREPDGGVDEDAQRRPGFTRTVVFFFVRLRECSSQTASVIILSLSRAMVVVGPSSTRSKTTEMLAFGFGSPRSCRSRRRTYSANEILSSAARACALR